MTGKITPEERARRAAEAMWAGDAASKWMGMSLDEIGPGRAVMSLTVAPEHLNGHGICHGGIIFSLADSTFAFACNSYNRNAVAQHCLVSYLSPGREGEKLTATATEVSRQGRSGIYDIEVRGEGDRLVATFRGFSREIRGTHFPEEWEDSAP